MLYNRQLICGTREQAAEGRLCRWPVGHVVKWHINAAPRGLTKDAVHATYEAAWQAWALVSGFRHMYTSNPRTADVAATFGVIDQPGKVLAWSEMPCGRHGSLAQMYDSADRWVIAVNPPAQTVDLARVMLHENGHALGIPHIATGNVMQAMYDVSIMGLQHGDILEIKARAPGEGLNPDVDDPPTPDDPDDPAPSDYNELIGLGYRGDMSHLVFRLLGQEYPLSDDKS